MLILKEIDDRVGAKFLQPQLMFLKEPVNDEEERVVEIIKSKIKEKWVKMDVETAKYLTTCCEVDLKCDQLLKNNAVISTEHANSGYFRIVCEDSKMEDAERDLRRLAFESTISEVPDYWEIPPDDNVYHAFELQPKSDEYMKVKNAFDKTASNEIVKIERIQNQGIYELYNVKRKAMKEKYGDADFPDKEKQLFHGTSKDNVEKINSGGLNRSFAGIHATAFGKGVYFARDASYSLRETYSPKDANGLRYVYYARVLVGDYANGNSSMLVPPSKNTADPNETYDSVVNDIKNPAIFVMFKDYQYYTEYLITFK